MKRSVLCFIAAWVFAAPFSFAQRAANWTLDITGNVQQIFFQNFTGVPIVQTEKAYFGIDPVSQKVAWTVERYGGKLKSLGGKIDTEGSDFTSMEGTPFVLVRNSVLESRTGEAILSKEKNNYKSVEDYEVIPDLNGVLVRTTADGMLRLYLIGLDDATIKWETTVMKISAIQVTGLNEEPVEDRMDVPLYTSLVTDDKHLIYYFKKTLAVISPEGKLLWSTKADPAEVLLSPDQQKILIVKALVTGVANSPVSVRYVTKYRANKIAAYNLKTGKEIWKDDLKTDQNIRWADAHPDFLAVVQKKGCNIYQYSTGEPIWEDDFKGKRVVEIQPNEKGYLITYESGYKTMQLGKKGKELWKEPKKLETDDDDEDDSAEEGNQDVYEYAKGKVLVSAERVRFKPAQGSGIKKWKMNLNAGSRVAYDDSLHNLLILHEKTLYFINPDQNPKVPLSFKDNYENLAAFHTLECREGGYFMSSSQEFIVFSPRQGKLVHRYYARPFDTKGSLLNVVHTSFSINGSALRRSANWNAQSGKNKASQASIGLLPPGSGNTERKTANRQRATADGLSFAGTLIPPARFEAFQQSQNFAYYFTKGKGDENILVKINKDTGLETDQLIFDSNRPVYAVDEVQKRVFFATKGVLKVFDL